MVSRILFVGDYDLAGGGIATRMYREGCKVSWLTSNRDKMLWGDRVHGKVHRLAITYNNCSQIIKGEAVDCIVGLTGIYRELDDQDAVWGRGTLLPMLVPVLRAAAAEQVRHICFLSSVRLGDEGLLEPGFEELRAGERIVTSFCQEKKIPLLVLRLDCVYGQRMLDGPNLVGDILRAMQKGKDVACPFTPDSEFDILFKWDMADAAYRLLNMDASGSFQVLTGSPVTARQLWEMAAAALGHEGTIRYGQKERHCPQGWDQEIRQLCGWMPFYPFAEHGAAIMERELARWRQDGAAAQKKTDWKTRLKKKPFLYETAQNLLLFGITVLLTRFTVSWSDLRFVDVRLLYVVIIAITFGMRQGLLATGLAIVSYTGSLLRSGRHFCIIKTKVSNSCHFRFYYKEASALYLHEVSHSIDFCTFRGYCAAEIEGLIINISIYDIYTIFRKIRICHREFGQSPVSSDIRCVNYSAGSFICFGYADNLIGTICHCYI